MLRQFKFIVAAGACAVALAPCSAVHAQDLLGAGSTFVNPIMTQWTAAYAKAKGAQINYQPIGSGGGISALIKHTVDFAGSDVPMNAQESAAAGSPVLHLPDVIGAVCVGYNIPGVGPGVRLTGPVLAKIFLGQITSWSDPAITSLNPGTKFPSDSIFVVHRSDGSGTTAIFTDYLSKVNSEWGSKVGSGKSVDWPAGLGGKGSAGVAGLLKAHASSIGYVELAYAVQNIPYALVSNKHGKYIYPSAESAALAAEGSSIPANLEMSIVNTNNPEGYPITGYSYLITYTHTAKAALLKPFLSWVTSEGQSAAFTKPLYYAPVPPAVRSKEAAMIGSIK